MRNCRAVRCRIAPSAKLMRPAICVAVYYLDTPPPMTLAQSLHICPNATCCFMHIPITIQDIDITSFSSVAFQYTVTWKTLEGSSTSLFPTLHIAFLVTG